MSRFDGRPRSRAREQEHPLPGGPCHAGAAVSRPSPRPSSRPLGDHHARSRGNGDAKTIFKGSSRLAGRAKGHATELRNTKTMRYYRCQGVIQTGPTARPTLASARPT